MAELFLKIVNMSISASWLVLAVLLMRLILRRAPKWLNPVLWCMVGIRLMVPFSIESALSLIPSVETISPEIMYDREPAIHSGVSALNSVVNPVIQESFTPDPAASANPLQIYIPVCAVIWILGAGIMLLYMFFSYWRLKRRLCTAVLWKENIYQSEHVAYPLVLGVIRPYIYLPFRMTEKDMPHVLAHEQAHIRRRDHLIKPLAFLLLSVHWFNPVIWVSYVLLCRDIELACDERVIKDLGTEQRADYSEALLLGSVPRKMVAACPLAFGEVGVQVRIRSVLNYKKPAFWMILLAAAASIVLAVCFLTNPAGTELSDITSEKGYTILSQSEYDMTLTIPKDALPDNIYTDEGHDFEENEVIAYQTDTTKIYLARVQPANEGDDQLYFMFNYSYDLPESGSILVPYRKTQNGYSSEVNLRSRALADSAGSYEGAVALRAQGPSEQFAFYVNTDACKASVGMLQIQAYCCEMTYEKEKSKGLFGNRKKKDAVEERLLTLDDVITLAKEGNDLTWEDFELYKYVETGSGLYIRVYEIDEMFSLSIGGGSPAAEASPMYMYLRARDGSDARIDIRTEDVEVFIQEHKNNPIVADCTYGFDISQVGYSEEGMAQLAEWTENKASMLSSSVLHLPVILIDSLTELADFRKTIGQELDLTNSLADAPAFENITAASGEEYFETNALLLVYLTESNAAYRPGVEFVRKSEGALSIGIMVTEPGFGDDVMTGWLVSVSVPRDQLGDVTSVDAFVSSRPFVMGDQEEAALYKRYEFQGEGGFAQASSIGLYDDGTFGFSFSPLSSYLGYGSYEIAEGRLVLKTSDGKYTYVFDYEEDHLVFDAKASSVMLWNSGIYDGAVFE